MIPRLKLARSPPIAVVVTRLLAPASVLLALAAAAPASAAVPFTTSSIPVTKPMGIAAADVDADGTTDLVTANSLEDKAHVLLGDGAGAFVSGLGSPLTLIGSSPAVAAGDLNHDGRADLVLPTYTTGSSVDIVGVVRNPGIDAFGPGTHPVIYAPLGLAPVTPRAVGLVGLP